MDLGILNRVVTHIVWGIIKVAVFFLLNWMCFAVAVPHLINQHDDTLLEIAIIISVFTAMIDLFIIGDVIFAAIKSINQSENK